MWRTTLNGMTGQKGVNWAEDICLGGKSPVFPWGDGHGSPSFGRWRAGSLLMGNVMALV